MGKYSIEKIEKDSNVKDPTVRKLFKYMKFVPFVPPTDVIPAFKKIRKFAEDSNYRKFESMFVYF